MTPHERVGMNHFEILDQRNLSNEKFQDWRMSCCVKPFEIASAKRSELS